MFIMTNEKYGQGAKLDEYEGTFSIVNATQAENGNVYTQWCLPRQGRDKYASKDIPMGVRLGGRMEAIRILENFVEALKRGLDVQDEPQTTPKYDPSDDIPF